MQAAAAAAADAVDAGAADAGADVAVAGAVAAGAVATGVVADSWGVVGTPLYVYAAGSSVEPLAVAGVAVGFWHLTRLAGLVSSYGPRKALQDIDVAVTA